VSDRLNELQRQRALVQEHLGWLEREIARELGQPAAPAATAAPVPPPPTPAPAPSAAVPATPADKLSEEAAARAAEEVFARYQPTRGQSPGDIKKGCVLYFVFAMGLLVIFTISAYFVYVATRDNSEGDPPAAVAP